MAENLVIEKCSTEISQDVKAHWEKKLPRVERLLQRFRTDQRKLRFHFDCASYGYEARAVLSLPTGTLVARTEAPVRDPHGAVDQVADRLAEEIRRHKELIRRDEVDRRKQRRERNSKAIEPHLAALRHKDDRKGFFELLRPHVRQLRDHARRDLIVAQLEGSMHPGELTVQDLLEEAIVRAWHDWHQRPRDESVDRWLVQLIHDVLDEKGFEAPDDKSHSKPKPASDRDAVSVYERVREDDPRFQVEEGADIETNPEFPYANENEWVVENNPYWPSLNPLTRDETIPDEHSPEPWQELADDEMRRLILNELRRFPKNQRRAFMLHALDGWSVEEIAQRQHRSADEVRADIERVRTELRQ